MKNEFHFKHIANNVLFDILREPEFASSLAYQVDFKYHDNLKIKAQEHSIELSNHEITISIIIYAGFERKEYIELKQRPNVKLISLSALIPTMYEFKDMDVKYIDKLSWLFSIIGNSKNDFVVKLNQLKSLQVD
jgi:hypothetical protein